MLPVVTCTWNGHCKEVLSSENADNIVCWTANVKFIGIINLAPELVRSFLVLYVWPPGAAVYQIMRSMFSAMFYSLIKSCCRTLLISTWVLQFTTYLATQALLQRTLNICPTASKKIKCSTHWNDVVVSPGWSTRLSVSTSSRILPKGEDWLEAESALIMSRDEPISSSSLFENWFDRLLLVGG